MKNINYLSAWRKGDLVRLDDEFFGSLEFRLTSEPYELNGKIQLDTDTGKPVLYTRLLEKGHLIETASGRKNEPCE